MDYIVCTWLKSDAIRNFEDDISVDGSMVIWAAACGQKHEGWFSGVELDDLQILFPSTRDIEIA